MHNRPNKNQPGCTILGTRNTSQSQTSRDCRRWSLCGKCIVSGWPAVGSSHCESARRKEQAPWWRAPSSKFSSPSYISRNFSRPKTGLLGTPKHGIDGSAYAGDSPCSEKLRASMSGNFGCAMQPWYFLPRTRSSTQRPDGRWELPFETYRNGFVSTVAKVHANFSALALLSALEPSESTIVLAQQGY